MSLVLVYDATGQNVGHLPKNASYAGYVTGSGSVPWSQAQLQQFPDVVRIAQSPNLGINEGVHADILDVENQAATLADCAPWAKHELDSFARGLRKGQRSPAIYFSASNVHNVVNALVSGGVKSGVGLWVANWNMTDSQAVAELNAAAGPFPVIGAQFHNAGAFDISVFSTSWLTTRSGSQPVNPQDPPGQWLDPHSWTWRAASIQGQGMDGQPHRFDYDANTGKWVRISLSNRYQSLRPVELPPDGPVWYNRTSSIHSNQEAKQWVTKSST